MKSQKSKNYGKKYSSKRKNGGLNNENKFFNNNGYVNKGAIGAGVYEFIIKKGSIAKSLYIGESFSMLARCADHVYELEKDKSY